MAYIKEKILELKCLFQWFILFFAEILLLDKFRPTKNYFLFISVFPKNQRVRCLIHNIKKISVTSLSKIEEKNIYNICIFYKNGDKGRYMLLEKYLVKIKAKPIRVEASPGFRELENQKNVSFRYQVNDKNGV